MEVSGNQWREAVYRSTEHRHTSKARAITASSWKSARDSSLVVKDTIYAWLVYINRNMHVAFRSAERSPRRS